MTVTATNAHSGPYTPNGATTAFPFTFKAYSIGEILVRRLLNGVWSTVSSGFTTTLSGDPPSGGTVTFAAAPATGSGLLYIVTDPDFTQDIAFENNGAFLPEAHDEANDRAAIRDIYLKDRLSRSVIAAPGDSGLELPRAADLAGDGYVVGTDPETGALTLRDDFRVSGGSADSIGLFIDADGIEIPGDTVRVTTAGYSRPGLGAASYAYNSATAAADTTFIASYPRAGFLDASNRPFKVQLYGLTPWQVGCLGGATDDAVPLQAYFNIARDNDLGMGDWGGKFRSSVPIDYGSDDFPPLTRNFRGILDITGTGGSGVSPLAYVLAVRNLSMLCAEGWRFFGTTAGNKAFSRTYVLGVLFDNVPRLSIRQQWFRHFQCAGAIGIANNNLSHYGFVKASDCGSGSRSSRNSDATKFGFPDTFSNPRRYAGSGSTRQRCILDYDDGPPSWLTDGRFGNLTLLGPSVRLTHKGGIVTKRYPIAFVDEFTQIAQLTDASATIQVEDSAHIDVGSAATGDYIPAGATVLSIVDATHVTLSAAIDFEASATHTRGIYFTGPDGIVKRQGTLTEGSLVVTVNNAASIEIGDEVTSTEYIEPGTYVDAIAGLNITLSRAHTYVAPPLANVNVTFEKPGTITLGVWPDDNVDYTKEADYCIGGPLVLRGNDHNVTSFDKIDAIRCGNAGPFHSLHVPAMSGVVTGQFCGTCIALGKFNGSSYGGNLNIYAEGCVEDVVISTPPSIAGYNVLNSEYALDLSRTYMETVPRNTDNSLVAASQAWAFGRFSYQGIEHDYEKAPFQGATSGSTFTHTINRAGYVANHRKDEITLKFILNLDVHRLCGFTNFVVNVVGEGTNPNLAPTSVTVSVPEVPVNCTLNDGLVDVVLDGFTGPAQICGRFEITDPITQVGSITNGSPTVDGLTTSRLSNGMYVTGVGIPSGTTITIVDADTVTLSQNATSTNAAAVLTFAKRNLRVYKQGKDEAPPGVQTVANQGKTLSLATSTRYQEWTGSNLSADRTVTLPAPRGNGRTYRVMRHTTAGGAGNLLVNTSAAVLLQTIAPDAVNNNWYDFVDSGGEYRLVGKGTY